MRPGFEHMWHQRSRIITIGVTQFFVVSTIAMFFYPGGTPWDPQTQGYTFWHNALSDLGRTIAYNGQENPIASPLFNATLLILGVSTFIGFISLLKDEHCQPTRGRRILLSGLGALASLGLIIVSFTPDNLLPSPHMIGVWLWGLCLCCLTFLIMINVFTTTAILPPKWLTGLLLLSITTLLTMGLLGMWSWWVTATQKVVLYVNMAWYLGFNRKVRL